VAELVREFHDLTAGTPLAAGCEVVCHNDLAPQNTVYRDAGAGRRMRLICDAYGLSDRDRLVGTVLWWQDRCWRGILAKAEAGEAAMIRLRDSGAAASVRREFDWVARHRAELAAALR
jgi:hypothetical protein